MSLGCRREGRVGAWNGGREIFRDRASVRQVGRLDPQEAVAPQRALDGLAVQPAFDAWRLECPHVELVDERATPWDAIADANGSLEIAGFAQDMLHIFPKKSGSIDVLREQQVSRSDRPQHLSHGIEERPRGDHVWLGAVGGGWQVEALCKCCERRTAQPERALGEPTRVECPGRYGRELTPRAGGTQEREIEVDRMAHGNGSIEGSRNFLVELAKARRSSERVVVDVVNIA